MKVIAINSSARAQGQSKTELMLGHLVCGMENAGADVEVINLRDKKIKDCMWQTCIDEGITREKFTNNGMMPRADSIETYMLTMSTGFNPDNAGDAKVIIQNDFTGRVEGSCHFIISDGTVQTRGGKSENPDLIIKSPFDVWIDIVTGKEDGTEMIMEGKYMVEGNTDLIFDVPKFFERKKMKGFSKNFNHLLKDKLIDLGFKAEPIKIITTKYFHLA